jgi:hypothetical protein
VPAGPVRLGGFGDPVKDFARSLDTIRRQIAKGDNADPLPALVHHGNAGDLNLTHEMLELGPIIILATPADVVGHDVVYLRIVRIEAGDKAAHGDVPIGQDAHQAMSVTHGEKTHVQLVLEPCRFSSASVGPERAPVTTITGRGLCYICLI